MGNVPKFVVYYTVLIGIIAIVASIPDIDAKGWSEAMRNAAPGFAGLAVFALAKKTPAAYFAVIVTRFAIEIGDILGGLTTDDTTTLILGGVVMLFDIAALTMLFPLLSNEEPRYADG